MQKFPEIAVSEGTNVLRLSGSIAYSAGNTFRLFYSLRLCISLFLHCTGCPKIIYLQFEAQKNFICRKKYFSWCVRIFWLFRNFFLNFFLETFLFWKKLTNKFFGPRGQNPTKKSGSGPLHRSGLGAIRARAFVSDLGKETVNRHRERKRTLRFCKEAFRNKALYKTFKKEINEILKERKILYPAFCT